MKVIKEMKIIPRETIQERKVDYKTIDTEGMLIDKILLIFNNIKFIVIENKILGLKTIIIFMEDNTMIEGLEKEGMIMSKMTTINLMIEE